MKNQQPLKSITCTFALQRWQRVRARQHLIVCFVIFALRNEHTEQTVLYKMQLSCQKNTLLMLANCARMYSSCAASLALRSASLEGHHSEQIVDNAQRKDSKPSSSYTPSGSSPVTMGSLDSTGATTRSTVTRIQILFAAIQD
jgi:hypothetical protein